jgi:hypothetical protein
MDIYIYDIYKYFSSLTINHPSTINRQLTEAAFFTGRLSKAFTASSAGAPGQVSAGIPGN